MCGNFGLLLLGYKASPEDSESTKTNAQVVNLVTKTKSQEDFNEIIGSSAHSNNKYARVLPVIENSDDLDSSSHGVEPISNENLLEEGDSKLKSDQSIFNGLKNKKDYELVSPIEILKAQTARTEFRGGQAGGISSLEYDTNVSNGNATFSPNPINARVRCVARKRFPLADDLSKLYKNTVAKSPTPKSTLTGHTRFATSSINIVPELHPHEWVPFHPEVVWLFDSLKGQFVQSKQTVGIHITHNGDFDAMEAYGGTIVVDEIGCWLERVHHVANNLRGDSPKVAGCMDLFRVQGRWAAAARLSWIRCVLSSEKDVCNGEQLDKSAPHGFPEQNVWDNWHEFFEATWKKYMSKVITVTNGNIPGYFHYCINSSGEKELIDALNVQLQQILVAKGSNSKLYVKGLSESNTFSFLHHSVRGFLRYDLYNALTELLSRAKGSFGLQTHCTLEPAVVVIASKGQPMSVAFDLKSPIVLFGSEAEALAVPVYKSGKWLDLRIDLDSKGEIFRLGEPRQLLEGTYNLNTAKPTSKTNVSSVLVLPSGLTIRSYSLVSSRESTVVELVDRYVVTDNPPFVHKGKWDLVAADLAATPGVLSQIDNVWTNPDSFERQAAKSLCENILRCMVSRISSNDDTTDLLISGIEASLWMAEQLAADMRMVFPNINVATISSNKLLGFGDPSPYKVFFPGSDEIQTRRMTNTCVLLVCQSGQSFPSLHATRKLIPHIKDKLWILTGCVHSKMECAMLEGYKDLNLEYGNNRIFLNFSGNRPAEPSSVAVAATWHTMSHILMDLIRTVRSEYPQRRLIHPWHEVTKTKSLDVDFVDNTDDDDSPVLMNLTDGCIDDIQSLFLESLVSGIANIVGYDQNGRLLKNHMDGSDPILNKQLIKQGKAWADHINEPWNILIVVGFYLFVSVSLGVTLFVLIGNIVVYILKAAKAPIGEGSLSFSLLYPSLYTTQPIAWTLIGLALQIMDSIFFIYLAKTFTYVARLVSGRPFSARFGKRTIVIVDTSCIHQLLENFVSKLYSQSYSFNGVEVHGSCGLDHFVHRFTHRVARGLLLAIGRTDGRLCCLAKSEAATLLAAKQAAFIRNPEYVHDGSGPEFVTIGHNPFVPNLGLAKHIVIKHPKHIQRRKFIDEHIYERLYLAVVPHAGSLLSSLAKRYNSPNFNDDNTFHQSFHQSTKSDVHISRRNDTPFGVQHIDPSQTTGWFKADFHKNELVKKATSHTDDFEDLMKDKDKPIQVKAMSFDPAVRLAFSHKLDQATKEVQERQVVVQQFYECRIAALERYLSFCVMFHAMAENSCKPWFRIGWDVARSQSNLRVATTASPIAAEGDADHELTKEIKEFRTNIGFLFRKVRVNF